MSFILDNFFEASNITLTTLIYSWRKIADFVILISPSEYTQKEDIINKEKQNGLPPFKSIYPLSNFDIVHCKYLRQVKSEPNNDDKKSLREKLQQTYLGTHLLKLSTILQEIR